MWGNHQTLVTIDCVLCGRVTLLIEKTYLELDHPYAKDADLHYTCPSCDEPRLYPVRYHAILRLIQAGIKYGYASITADEIDLIANATDRDMEREMARLMVEFESE